MKKNVRLVRLFIMFEALLNFSEIRQKVLFSILKCISGKNALYIKDAPKIAKFFFGHKSSQIFIDESL